MMRIGLYTVVFGSIATVYGCSGGAAESIPVDSSGAPDADGAATVDASEGGQDASLTDSTVDGSDVADAAHDARHLDGGELDAAPDPCPTNPLLVDCSGACGTAQLACDETICKADPTAAAANDETATYDVRTKAGPFPYEPCFNSTACNDPQYIPAYAMVVAVHAPGPRVVRVAPPWTVNKNLAGAPWCLSQNPALETNCFTTDDGVSLRFAVLTRDPNAPARNVTIEPFGTCP